MKANAPEKLYFGESDKGLLDIYSNRESNDDIEYTRTDAFIEKACDAYCAICDTKECGGCAECTWVIKFRRQLEKLEWKESNGMDDKEICASCKHLKKGVCPDWFENCKLRKVYEEQLKRNRV